MQQRHILRPGYPPCQIMASDPEKPSFAVWENWLYSVNIYQDPSSLSIPSMYCVVSLWLVLPLMYYDCGLSSTDMWNTNNMKNMNEWMNGCLYYSISTWVVFSFQWRWKQSPFAFIMCSIIALDSSNCWSKFPFSFPVYLNWCLKKTISFLQRLHITLIHTQHIIHLKRQTPRYQPEPVPRQHNKEINLEYVPRPTRGKHMRPQKRPRLPIMSFCQSRLSTGRSHQRSELEPLVS